MTLNQRQRHLAAAVAVAALGHAVFLWVLHDASRKNTPQMVVPVRLMATFVTLVPIAPAQFQTATMDMPAAPAPAAWLPAAMSALAVADAPLKTLVPPHAAPQRVARPAPPDVQVTAVSELAATASQLPQLADVVVRSSSAAATDLLNPALAYPSTSLHLREAGRVVVRVLVGANGQALEVVLQRSSGFERLDQVALETLRGWRFDVDAYRAVHRVRHHGASDAQWVLVPIHFVME